ncbi:hypothetical protein ABPG72_010848, partial [Tetrahymena utriculariae]
HKKLNQVHKKLVLMWEAPGKGQYYGGDHKGNLRTTTKLNQINKQINPCYVKQAYYVLCSTYQNIDDDFQKINCLFCPTDQCFSKAQSKCLDIIQNNYTGISKQGYCVSDGEQSQIDKCLVMQNQICVNQLNTMCIMLANSPSSDFIGIFQDESSNLTCIEQSDVQNKAFNAEDIKLLNSAYCYQNDRLIYPYQHPLDSINCQCQPKQCFDGSNCLPMDENINVGINNQGRCVGINKIDDLKDCYQPLFCLQKTSQSQSQCIPFLSQTQVIGVFQEKNVYLCVLINDISQPLPKNIDMKVSSKQIVGVTKNKSCVTINTQIDQSDQIDSCIYGYCISQQNCVQMNGRSIISKLQNNQCGGDSQTNFKECYASFQTSPLTCIQNNTCEVIKNSKNIVGVKSGLQCIYQDDLLQDKNQIQFCSKFHCIQNITTTSQVQQKQEKQTVTVNITLTSFKCQQQDYWLGSDSQGYCINSTQMICIKDNQCLYIDPMTQQQQCQLLSGQQNSPYFAKEDQTTKCLPFKSIKDSGQNIDKCPDGYCIYEPSYQQKYCVTIGDYVNGQLFIGREIDTQYCLIPLQLSFANSISCLLGDYCLLSGVCFKLSYQNINTIGRSSDNSCLPANTQLSTNCAMGYCLLKLECIPLSPQYPGRENLTENCLQEYETKSFGAQQCCSQYCLQLGQTQMLNQCVSLDYQNPNQIGIYKDSGTCVSQSDQYIPHQNQLIQTCFQGVYCINTNQNGEYYQKVEGNIKCSDSQGKCVSQNSSSQCYRCPFSQCLQNGVCIPLNNQFCQDVLGKCLRIQQSGCTVCPLGFCLQQQNGTCLSQYLVNTSDYAHTECLLQYRQDAKCYKQDINQINKFQTNICKDQFNICQIITSNDQAEICLICPQFFANPGNRQCYKKIKNVQNGYFNFELQYIQEDCFPNSICSQGSIKCPEGCRSCQDENTCTLCIENYFLFFDSQRQKQMCVKCDNSEYEYQVDSKSQLFNYVTKLNIQCAECNLQSNYWANSQYLQKICTQFVVSIAGVKKLSDKFSTSFYYQVQKANPQGSMFKITRIKQPDQCEPQCLSCDIDLKGNARCIKCQQLYYVNSLYQCSQCPLGCLECGMSMIEDNRILNFEDLTYEQYKNNRFNFQISILTCRYCKDGYMVSENLSSCEQCGYACLKCTYRQNYVNSKIFGLAVYPTNKLNKYCLQCNQGYTLDIYNRFDCNKLYTPYCSDTDLLVYNTKHSKTYFQYRADKKQDVVVTSCNICYPGSCLYDYYCLINYQNPEDVYTNSYLCQGYFFKCTFSDSYGNCFNWKQYGIYLTIDKSFQEQPLIINSTPPNYSDLKRKCSNLVRQNLYNIYFQIFFIGQIPNCINCLEFTNYKEGILYQCTKCKYGYIPSISQCIPCPDGCQSCFEAGYLQNDRVNFTNIFVNERNILSKLTFQQRIQYQETYKIDMLCSSCLDGRQLNSNQTSCDLPKCGSFCSKCIFYLDEPLCVQCNKNLLFSYIMPIQMYISNMYFNSDYLKEFNQMITYDSSQQNCKLCPMLCETCEDRVNQFAEGSLYFYQTKCYTCKQKIVSEYLELQRYQIRYDRQRKKCQLCLINDKGCYFKKVSKIYVYCGNQSQLLGKGTIDDPYNISKLQGQNLNEIILNELDFMRALVSYNELQLREIEIIIEYVDQNYICYENIQLAIQTNLKAQIYSLEYLSLTIRANQTQNNQNFVINQIKSAIITGFNKIVIENIDFIQKQKEDSFGFVIQNNFIDSLTVTNSSFSQISNISNLFTLRILQFNGTMIINNLRFNNITISSSKLINIQFLLPSSSLKYGIQNLVIFNCSLQSSYLQELYQSANLMINNIQILNSNLTQFSTVIKAFLDYQNSLQISTMFINQFTSQSQNSNAMLFNIDFLNVTNFNFKGNNLIDAIIFSLSQTSNIQSQNNQYNFTTIKFQENKIITQNSVIFKLEFISNAQSFIRIDSKVDGSIIFQNLTALNVSKFNNQNNDDTYDPNMTTSSLWISNQVGYLEINDSIFTSQKYNQQHYMLQIASTYVNITNTIFDQLSNNQIQQSSVKGGLTQVNCQALNLLNCTFKGGIAFQGGAIYWSAIDQAKILIDKSLFINNKSQDRFYAEESYGGAIFIDITLLKQTLQIFILNSDFQNNLSLSRGGSIYISKSKSKYFLVVRNSNFTDNISVQGSAIYSLQSNYQSQILFQIIQFKLSNNMINLSKNMLSYAQKSLRQNELPSHFRIQNHYSLDFVQCSFTSSLQYLETNNYENNFLLLTYQSLFNIQAINKLYFLKNQHKNMVTFNNLIKINCLNVQFQYEEYSQNTAMAQLNLIQSNQQNSLVYIKSNQTTINQIVFENNSCSACQQGSIYINSIYLLIINSLFQKNVALNGGSLYLTIPSQIKSSRLLIQNQFQYNQIQTTEMIQILQNCSFIQNIATINGGAIFIENSNLYISESFFAQNKAYSYGGAIASNSNNKNVVDNVNIINSKFILNEAKIGSAFFQLQNLPIKSIYQNVLANNKAQLYGNSLVSQPVGYQGVQEGKQKNKRIILTNFTSGIISQNIQIKLINTESEVVSELQDYIILSFETDQQDITIIPNQIRQKSGIFHLKDIMSVNGRLGSNITVNVTSNLNYIPIYDELGNLINTQQSEPFYLIIQFINLCPKGTSLIQDSQKKDFCFNCPTGTFNLNDGSKCFKCPFVCKKDQMFLPIGYWRSSLIDYTYQSCLIPFNCFGDVDRIVPQQLQSSSNRYCKEGNVGILCLDCDIEGQFWSESFYQITPFRCLKCGVQFNIMSIIIALANVSFYYFMIREIQNILAFLKLKQVFLLLGQRIFYKPQIFYMLNNFIEYIQIISLISPLMNDLPLQLYQIILEFTNFPLNMLKILDCELYKLFNMQYFPYWYFRIVIALIFQFLICLIVTILLYIMKCNKTTIQTFNLFIWIHSIPYIFKLCIGMSSFISLEGQNYIKDYPSLLWSNNQIGLITCLVLIMGQIFFITAINFYLSSFWNNQLYNIFTFLNQSNKYIWWESFSIGYRMLLNLIESLFFQVNSIKSSILCCLSLSYCISIFYYWPYQSKQRNQVKIIIHFGFSVCFGIMNYIDSNVAKDSSIILIYLIQTLIAKTKQLKALEKIKVCSVKQILASDKPIQKT